MIVTVDWADPINSPASEIMDKVKVLYVKNLASTVTEECLVTTFSAYGEVEKAKKLKGFFIINGLNPGILKFPRNLNLNSLHCRASKIILNYARTYFLVTEHRKSTF